MQIASLFKSDTYIMRLAMVFAGTAVLGLGISLSVIANVIMNSGEAFVKALADLVHKEFGNVKIVFDISCVAASVLMSLIFFDLKIVGAREGAVIAAFCTGIAVRFFTSRLRGIERFLC